MVRTLLTVDEANTVSRTPKAEVMSFVLSELLAAAAELPATRPDEEKGRITKGGALALLGRVQMAEKLWSDAQNTFKQIMDLDIYEIDPRFKELFEDDGENSTEIILSMKRMQDLYGNSIMLSCNGFTWGGYHHYSPYNELVEAFECIDGLPIDESPTYDVDDPYKDRDPRLYMTIMIDRLSIFKNILYVAHPDSSPSVYKDQLTRRPWSGYLLHKFMDEDYEGTGKSIWL